MPTPDNLPPTQRPRPSRAQLAERDLCYEVFSAAGLAWQDLARRLGEIPNTVQHRFNRAGKGHLLSKLPRGRRSQTELAAESDLPPPPSTARRDRQPPPPPPPGTTLADAITRTLNNPAQRAKLAAVNTITRTLERLALHSQREHDADPEGEFSPEVFEKAANLASLMKAAGTVMPEEFGAETRNAAQNFFALIGGQPPPAALPEGVRFLDVPPETIPLPRGKHPFSGGEPDPGPGELGAYAPNGICPIG